MPGKPVFKPAKPIGCRESALERKRSVRLGAMGSCKMLRAIMDPRMRMSRFAPGMLITCLIVGALGMPCANAGGEKELLAPTGHLRIGVYAGSPTSMVTDAGTGQSHGLTYDLGRELAARLNVPTEYVTFPRIADVVDAMKQGQIDFTVTNATPARATDVRFSEPLLAIELGYLVPANSSISSADEMDRTGIRLGVTKGGTSDRVLSAKFKNATIIAAESVKLAIEMLRRGELDGYATNKAILFQMSDALPGARILDGNWGLEHMAIAIPKGREQALPFVAGFAQEVQASGLVGQIQQQAGLRGAAK
jgi:polar amino acid transport system substrate-binding protein